MRIAQISPLHESVPPRLYGGTERIVSCLTEQLVAMGHEVTLFASADSRTSAQLIPQCPRAIRLDPDVPDGLALHVRMIDQVGRMAEQFDVLHFHIDTIQFPLAVRLPTPSLTTLHGRLDLTYLRACFYHFRQLPFNSISNAQREPMPWLNWQGTVYHGQRLDLYRPRYEPGNYLAFLGRMSREKRPDRAIHIARLAGLPLKIAAKIDPLDQEYFDRVVRPLLPGSTAEFVGEIGEGDKEEFLGRARALLFPIDWPEPFGLVMIEAMATGTPVIAYGCGSVPEVVDDGVTGFVVSSFDEAVQAVALAEHISRRECRAAFERRFSADRMAREYVAIYERLARQRHHADAVAI